MRLTKEKIINAAEAFNHAKTFDEFKVLLDLCNVNLEDFEQDYYELAMIHPIFASIIPYDKKNLRFDSKAYMSMNPNSILELANRSLDRFILPIWFEKDMFGAIKITLPGHKDVISSYSTEFNDDIRKFGIDPDKELRHVLLYELVRIMTKSNML